MTETSPSLVIVTLASDYCGSMIHWRTETGPLNAVYARSATRTADLDGIDVVRIVDTVGNVHDVYPENALEIRPAEFDVVGRPV